MKKIFKIDPNIINLPAKFRLAILLNQNLSLKNKSLFWIIYVYGGKVTIDELLKICNDGKASISSGIKELEALGFIKSERVRDPHSGKWCCTTYQVNLHAVKEFEGEGKERYNTALEEMGTEFSKPIVPKKLIEQAKKIKNSLWQE